MEWRQSAPKMWYNFLFVRASICPSLEVNLTWRTGPRSKPAHWPFGGLSKIMIVGGFPSNERGEPAAKEQMNRLGMRINRLKFTKTPGNSPVVLEESIEYTPNSMKENWKMSTCNHRLGQRSGRVLGTTGWDPSVCKSNRLHVDILRFSFMKLGYILYFFLKWSVFFLHS